MRNLLVLLFLCLAFWANAQYSETFSVANKGYQTGCVDDINAVNWTLSAWSSPSCAGADNRDAGDYFNTTAAGVLESIDLDQEVCWESPLINTVAAPTVSIKVDLTWIGLDTDVMTNTCGTDYINVLYSVNGGAYTLIPNVKGGSTCATVGYVFENPGKEYSDNVTINQGGVAGGSTLKIRVCVKTSANAEKVTIDNVSVPEAGVTVGCAAPILSTTMTQVGCSNPNSGAIDLSVSGGTPGYTYAWTGGATTQDISSKPTGTYTVTVTDAAMCTATISTTITAAPALVLTTTVLDASCNGNTDGEVGLDVSGGVPGYTYDWSNDGAENPDNDAEDLVNVGSGNYTVTVTDASGCTATTSATVNVLPSGAYNEQFNTPNKGYLANYVDDFAGVNWTLSGWSPQPPAVFGRDLNDTYRTSGGQLVGIDFDQEICWESPLIDLNGGTVFSVDLSWAGFDNQVDEYINVSYSIDGGGYITLPNMVGGGAGTIQYAAGLDQSGFMTVNKMGLSGSTIQIQICANFNDDVESITIDNVTIPGSNPFCPAPEPSLTPTNVTCNSAANGSIATTVSNGTSPYTYSWSNMATTQNLNSLAPGTYTVTVTDANMNTGTASTTITEPTAILLPTTQVNVLCNGAATGSIDLTPSGGTPGYTYAWTGGATTQDRSGLSAGTYTVTVTDTKSCTKTVSVTITQATALVLTETRVNVLCNGAATGSIDLTVSGGTGAYTYSWTGGATTQDITGKVAGTYTVTVTDVNACTKTLSVTLTEPAAIVLTESHVNVLCNGNSTGTIDLSVTGGTGAYTYSWTGGVTTQDRSGLSAGTYTVTVTDANACSKTTSVSITQPTPILLLETHVNILCNGGATGSIDLTPSGGIPAYTYSWTGGATTQDRSGLIAGTYTVTVTDANNCTQTTSVTLTEPGASITLSSTFVNPSNCNVADGSIDLTVAGGALPYSFDWSNDGSETPDNDTEDLASLVEGTYTVTVTDNNTCTATHTRTLDYIDVINPTITCPANVLINANASCAGALGSYAAASVSDNCNASPSVTQSPASGTALSGHNDVETVTLTANDGNGNTATCNFTVTLKDVTAPSISCPANTIINANASCGGTVGAYSASTLSDNCNPSPTVTQSPASGTALSGHNDVETVTLTADDGNGNTATCNFTVTLKDVTAPSISCPANTIINANASCGGTVGAYVASTLSDNCNPSPTVTQSPASNTALNGHNDVETVTLTANDGNGNTATCNFTVTLKDVTAPSITCPANLTINANASCGGTLGTYGASTLSDNCNPSPTVTQSPASGTALSGHNDVETVTLTANDGNGNTATCNFTVTLKDVTAPSISCPANTIINANASCSGTVGAYSASTLSDNCNPSPTVTQSPASSTVLSGHNDVETITLTANDGNGNTATCNFTVTLKDVTAPSITCPANTIINANASCGGTVGAYSASTLSDNCNPSPIVTQSPASNTALSGHNDVETVTLTANDGNGNTATCNFTVTLKDVTAPSITCPSNLTINANASCGGTVGAYSASTLSDNCNPTPTVTQSPASGTALSGHNDVETVTLTANDGNGTTATCNFTVTLIDVSAPSITCPANTTVNANASCGGTVGAYSASNLSDNCNPSPIVTQSPASSTVLSGHNDVETITLTANDGNGNTATCNFTVTLKDVTAPSITCPANTTINANASCSGTVGAYVASTLSDNCNPSPAVTQSPASSTVLSGHNDVETVTLTANDGNGNTATCNFTVTLKDVTAPSITCPANTTVNANASCGGTVGAYSASTLSDNCNPNPSVTQSPASSTVLSGHNDVETVTLTANDGNGNTATCNFTVTLKDVTAPNITCPANVTVAANGSCTGTVGARSPATLSDNCNASPSVTQSPIASTALNGHNDVETVTLTANDGNGNTNSCSFTVTLKDVTPPNITCPSNLTLNANASCNAAIGAYLPAILIDNCSATPTASQSPVAGTILSGHNAVLSVSLTGSDGNGNTQNCSFTITLKDVTPPALVCKNATVNLNALGNVNISPTTVYQSGSDNCGVVNLESVTPSFFTCNNIGANLVTLTANDGNGNSSTCNATVTVRDVTPPVAKCKNITANLLSTGTVTVVPTAVNNGTTDNCSVTFTLTPNTFTCFNIGVNIVTLKATDAGGNTSTCTARVTVKDVTGPNARCKNPTIFLDDAGHATLSVAQVNNASTDACGISTMSISKTSFNCSEITGPNAVTLSLTDVNGNSSSCLANVIVKDAIAPTPYCENVTVELGANGIIVVYGATLAGPSTDNCSVYTYTPVAKVYNTANLGDNNLTIYMKDFSGNESSCVSVVTVEPHVGFNPGRNAETNPKHLNLSVFPNPTTGDVSLAFELSVEQPVLVRLYDMQGRLVLDQSNIAAEGQNTLPVRLQGFAPGIYLLDFQADGLKKQTKVVVQK